MRLVIVESPYAGRGPWPLSAWRRWRNVAYARACVRDSLSRGEAPIASHLLYTQRGILLDGVPAERRWGITAGLAWGAVADATVVYVDRGISGGMEQGVRAARASGRLVEFRELAPGMLARSAAYADHLMAGRGGDLVLEPAVPDKGGRNTWPSQVVERPAAPKPIIHPGERVVPRVADTGTKLGRPCDCVLERLSCNCMRDGVPTREAKPPTITC